jgi:hypothetical protein
MTVHGEKLSNCVSTFDQDELLNISKMAAMRAKIAVMTKPQLTVFLAEVVVGKVKEFCYNVTFFGISGLNEDSGYGNDSDSVLIHLEEAEEDLGFTANLTEDFLVTKEEWKNVLSKALKSMR